MSKTLNALKKLAKKLTGKSTIPGKTIDAVLEYANANFDMTRKITYGTPVIDRYEGTTPIYRVYGVEDLAFTNGVATEEITYDASEKQMVACGCSASVNFGTSPQTSIITSTTYGDLKVEAGVTGGSGVHKVVFNVTDTKQTPTATIGILYYWYEYKDVD